MVSPYLNLTYLSWFVFISRTEKFIQKFITLTQELSDGEIVFSACRAGAQTCPANELPSLLHTSPSSLALALFVGGLLAAQMAVLDCVYLLSQGEFMSIRVSLASLSCYASHPWPKVKQNVKWQNLAEKNVDDASSEAPTSSLEALQHSQPLL